MITANDFQPNLSHVSEFISEWEADVHSYDAFSEMAFDEFHFRER